MDINNKINSVLLVDDDDTNNFYNKIILREEVGFTGEIKVCYNGKEALEFLQSKGSMPDIILLDINMPIMNGFEFLDRYEDLPNELKAKVVICMLTSSLSDSDKEKAGSTGIIKEYFGKPLEKELLIGVMNKYL